MRRLHNRKRFADLTLCLFNASHSLITGDFVQITYENIPHNVFFAIIHSYTKNFLYKCLNNILLEVLPIDEINVYSLALQQLFLVTVSELLHEGN